MKIINNMEIGTAIRMHRKNAKITQKNFAILCEISNTAMNQIECNVSFPSKKTLDKISNVLNLPLSFILLSCIDDNDIPNEKKFVFNVLKTAMQQLLTQQ